MNLRRNKNLPNLSWTILIFALGLSVGILWNKVSPAAGNIVSSLAPDREGTAGGKLINPLLDCEFAQNAFVELQPFSKDVKNYINQITSSDNHVSSIALYFRDLNNGPWFGINEKTDFAPASLLKVPLMIAYFKKAESDPSILKKTYIFKDDGAIPNTTQTILPSQTVQIGHSYTVEDLIYRMIVYSDNLAQHLLVVNIDIPTLSGVFSDFGIDSPSQDQPQTQTSVQGYGRFFRVLFNASYLNKEYSEKSLELLAQSEFKDGLVAGVPKGIVVAHKFGERQLTGQPENQLHDCGIVYYPNHPYLLCIMSRGDSTVDLTKAVSDISGYIYNAVDTQYRSK